ncbi:hypothetical protein Vretimale_9569 [Volvox reticuliferus]|uniref:Serine aminopeptidase S33 domain-containing protein n=1 Tax=Volvox reticuliferus TaxID=1737510 RepID=A0A8J4FUR8_9CHLO|nr:hypothetical protein Vretifemale_18794 [Volvox reticuliferus]GIM05089.1 hypothetical protein Vretimale_9569 [Volvox reticuliferus]
MGKISGSFTNARGQKLHTVEWTPDEGVVTAVLFWIHGFGEYIDRFEGSAKSWLASGIAVYGFDAHGMGLSEPLDDPSRALVRRFSYLVDDAVLYLETVLQPALAARGVNAPLFVGGNSLGGLIASYVVLARPDSFAGLIMQSPAIDVEWTPVLKIQAALGSLMAAIVPRAKLVPAVRPEDMSQDPAVVKEYLEDPMIYKGNVRALSGNEILKGFRALVARRAELKVPILAIHGTSDRCTSLPALREMLKHVSSTDVTLEEVAGGYHELLHGPEKEAVRKSIGDWILAHATAAPAATADKQAAAEQAQSASDAAAPATEDEKAPTAEPAAGNTDAAASASVASPTEGDASTVSEKGVEVTAP